MKFQFLVCFTFIVLVRGGDCDEVDYYVDLINNETARATTYPLPVDSSYFKPNSVDYGGNTSF